MEVLVMLGFAIAALGFISLLLTALKEGTEKKRPANWRFDRELYNREVMAGTVTNHKLKSGYYYREMTKEEIKRQYPMFTD
jgi:hypothetical protein